MHDPKFEKDVHQKMEELVFTPPASVWLNVEKEINKEKKRRFIPFWLFLLPALVLVGASAIYFYGSKNKKGQVIVDKGQAVQVPPYAINRTGENQEASRPAASQPVATVPTGSQPAPAIAQPKALSSVDPKSAASQPHVAGPTASGSSVTTNPTGPRSGAIIPGSPRSNASGPGLSRSLAAQPQVQSQENDGNSLIANRQKRPSHELSNPGQRINESTVAATHLPIKPLANTSIEPDQTADLTGSPGLAGARPFAHRSISHQRSAIDLRAAAITASAPPSQVKSPASGKTRLPEPRRPWEAGFAGGIGISSLNQGLLDKSTVTSAAYSNYASAVTGVPETYVSNAQPDLSFWAGVLLQKGLRKDLSLSLGLNLHYYSSKIKTGKMVNSDLNGQSSVTPPTSQSGSFVLGNSRLAAAAYPYYSPGNNESFTNRYYFLELPASVSWQVGHSRSLPLFWEGGFSLSYLVSSNSLYYDPKSGVFFKDGSVINRTQASVFTGLMVGLPLHGLRIQAGPQIQYGFTDLLNSEGTRGQHLLYGGIKLVFLPGKWKK